MNSERAMLRGALIPTAITAVISIATSTIVVGKAGLLAALLAQVIVVLFFAANIGTARLTRDLDPVMTMGFAMFGYTAKVVLLGIFLWLIQRFVPIDLCNRTAFGLSAVAATFAWLGGEIAAFLKLKLHLQLPPK
jgi:ATP synthase protein I